MRVKGTRENVNTMREEADDRKFGGKCTTKRENKAGNEPGNEEKENMGKVESSSYCNLKERIHSDMYTTGQNELATVKLTDRKSIKNALLPKVLKLQPFDDGL